MTTSSGERDHLVVTVHGIRTFGFWQERLEALLRSDATGEERHRIEVLNYKYGYFSAIAFMIPLLRWLVVRQFRRTLEKQLARRSWRRVDIVAHSFGTHLVGWSLLAMKNGPHRVHTVIVAGSVLRSDFPWNELIGTTVRRVVSECGTSDSILLLSQFFVLFTGMAGRVGFSGMTGETLRNRFYEIGHSGYFLSAGRPSDDFMAANWLPLLARDEAVALRDDPRSAGALDGLKTWITNNMEPVKLTAYVLPLVAVIVWVLSLYIAGEANRRVSDAARTASIASMRLGPDATPEMARARLQSALAAARTFRSLGADGSPATIALASATRDVPKRIATIAAANPLVAFDARSRFAAVAEGKELRIIDALSGRTRAAWTLTDALTAIAIHPRADEVAVGDSRGSLTTIDLVSKRGKRSTHEMNGPVESVVYNDTGEVLGAVAREPSAAAVRIVDSSDRLLASDTYALTIEG
ncbi:MAG TPA: hypothetical protein VF698_07355, partial [Thermoanaerobaculia bacterium]